MKILVTGSNGGSHLVKQLTEKGYQVDGLDYKKSNDISHYMERSNRQFSYFACFFEFC